MGWDDEDAIFHVVVNDEQQYSIWLEYKELFEGWRTAGKTGSKQECLDYIETVWTDLRPLSLCRAMEAQAAAREPQS